MIENEIKDTAQRSDFGINDESLEEADISEHIHRAALGGGLGEGLGLQLNTDYFDIESFLVDQTLVDVVTLDLCPFGRFAAPAAVASNCLHLKKGVLVKLPLAAATLLHEQGLVTVHMPSIFDEGIVLNLRRNPTVVDVGSLHPYYFEFGIKLASLFNDTQLAATLRIAAEKRLILLMKLACDQVEAEGRDIQNKSGLISEAVALDRNEFHSKDDHLFSRSTWQGTGTSACIFGDTFLESQELPHLHDFEAALFLKGLSASEARLFQERKEECHRIFSTLLF